MPSVQELRANGLACFTHVDTGVNLATSPHYAQLQSISNSLAEPDFVSTHLHDLETEMSTELVRRIPDPGRYSLLPPPDRTAKFKAMYPVNADKRKRPTKKYRNLFSTVMRRMEAENGFGELSYAWGVSAQAFLANLKARRPFKDYSASPNYHGEHTHRVQWWLICKFVLPPSGNNAQYYEECAYWTCNLTGTPDGNNRTIYLWDYLFDSASNTTCLAPDESVGRNPNNVYTLCRKPAYPLLSQFMWYRMLKTDRYRSTIISIDSDNARSQIERLNELHLPPAILERAARRFAGKSFSRLGAKEQTELVDTLMALGFTDHDLPDA